jgi:uncharacterized protein (DUF1800 family)
MKPSIFKQPKVSDAQLGSVAPASASEANQEQVNKAGLTLIPVLGSAALVACGGGSDSTSIPKEDGSRGSSSPPDDSKLTDPSQPSQPSQPTTPAPPGPGVDVATASSFLGKAGFGGDLKVIAKVQELGFSAWLDQQLDMPLTVPSRLDYIKTTWPDWQTNGGHLSRWRLDKALWAGLIQSPDVLRQRVALALSEIFVVSLDAITPLWRSLLIASYFDMLQKNAFGNYRKLLEDVTLSPAMWTMLSVNKNRKANTAGRVPDENYAREVLQLFSIGLHQLAQDGTLLGGVAKPTYTLEDVTGLASVFTGWSLAASTASDPTNVVKPMVFDSKHHTTDSKNFLNLSIAANTSGEASLKIALDHIANHANVGPFIGKQLIQRLVTSNPSPAYVARVAAVFNNNGAGIRGDLKAVVKSILLDHEAWRVEGTGDTARGKLREPMIRFVQWARTFNVSVKWNNAFEFSTSDPARYLGQSPMRSGSVFNFFRPGFTPSSRSFSDLGLKAPELQITDETSVIGWINFAETMVQGKFSFATNSGGTRSETLAPNYDYEISLAANPEALTDHLSVVLAGGRLSVKTKTIISQAIRSMSSATSADKLSQVHAAVHLVLCSPEYLVQV